MSALSPKWMLMELEGRGKVGEVDLLSFASRVCSRLSLAQIWATHGPTIAVKNTRPVSLFR